MKNDVLDYHVCMYMSCTYIYTYIDDLIHMYINLRTLKGPRRSRVIINRAKFTILRICNSLSKCLSVQCTKKGGKFLLYPHSNYNI